MIFMGNRPDAKCIFCYLQSLYNKLKKFEKLQKPKSDECTVWTPSPTTPTTLSSTRKNYKKTTNIQYQCVWLYTEYNEAWKTTACPGPMPACNRDCLDTAQMELDTKLHFICSDKTSNCSCCMIILKYKPTRKKLYFIRSITTERKRDGFKKMA